MFENIFGEKFLRNPNLIDVELLGTEIRVIKELIEQYVRNGATAEEKTILFYPILAKLETAMSAENQKKNYEKSLIN